MGRLAHDCPRQGRMGGHMGVDEGGEICMGIAGSNTWVVHSSLGGAR